MEIVVWMIFGALWGLISFGAGVYVARQNMVDYKKRWQQAVKLLEGGPEAREKVVLIKPPEGPPQHAKKRPGETELTQADLFAMSNSARVTIEVNRLRAGLPPRDNLAGMSNSAIIQIENERTRKGWM